MERCLVPRFQLASKDCCDLARHPADAGVGQVDLNRDHEAHVGVHQQLRCAADRSSAVSDRGSAFWVFTELPSETVVGFLPGAGSLTGPEELQSALFQEPRLQVGRSETDEVRGRGQKSATGGLVAVV